MGYLNHTQNKKIIICNKKQVLDVYDNKYGDVYLEVQHNSFMLVEKS